MPPSPNTALVLSQSDAEKETTACKKYSETISVISPFRVNIEVTRGHQRSKLANSIFIRKCVIVTSLLIEFCTGVFTSLLHFTSIHGKCSFRSSKNISKLFCNTTLSISSMIYRYIHTASKTIPQRLSISSRTALT